MSQIRKRERGGSVYVGMAGRHVRAEVKTWKGKVITLRGSLISPAGMDGAVEVFAIRIGSLVQVVLVNGKENDEPLKQMHAS